MRRLGLCLLLLLAALPSRAEDLTVTTWNLEWFPNGSPRVAAPEEQSRRIEEAAKTIRALNPDVLLLQEIQDYRTCERLVEAIGAGSYQICVCSAFREATGAVSAQQVAILAKQPAHAAWSERWKSLGVVDPPRGFAFAWLQIKGIDLVFYSVHLKSNLVRSGSEREIQLNILKRELAAEQLVRHLAALKDKTVPSLRSVLVGGDFNTNRDQAMFVSERTLETLTRSGFEDCWEERQLRDRVTHPGKGAYPDATFDYLFQKGMRLQKARAQKTAASDHFPVTGVYKIAN